MKQKFIFLVFALILPSAVAFNCDGLSGGDLHVCQAIQDANLTNVENDLFISDIFNPNKTTPNFDFVYLWNTNLNFTSSPDGKESSYGTINNAWIKIISLMPSIINNKTLYSSNNEKLLTAYSYRYTLPSGTTKGDCKTEYSLESKNEDLKIYLNNNLIGKDKLISFIISNESNDLIFKSELNILINYKVVHYRKQEINDAMKCVYYSTEHRSDNLKISDLLNAKFYKSQLDSEFKIIDKYNGITKGNLTVNNFTKLILSFNNSFYQNSRYIYSLNYSLPNYILTLKAEELSETDSNNIYVDKINNSFIFTVKDSSGCKIELSDFFNSISKNCDMSFNKTNFSIKTDKTNYYENDTIKVFILPSNLTINLSYANQSKIVKNYTEFKSVLYENKIIGKLDEQELIWVINVNKKENWRTFYDIVLLFFLVYLIYKLSKAFYLNASRSK